MTNFAPQFCNRDMTNLWNATAEMDLLMVINIYVLENSHLDKNL